MLDGRCLAEQGRQFDKLDRNRMVCGINRNADLKQRQRCISFLACSLEVLSTFRGIRVESLSDRRCPS
jgi:hypothetical protein